MADNITESGLNFEPRVDPRTTHDNWLQNKLHEMTMASESRIKFETMGAGNWTYFRKQLATMIQADMAADIGEGRPVSSLFPFLTLVGMAIYEDGFKPYFEKQKIKRISDNDKPYNEKTS